MNVYFWVFFLFLLAPTPIFAFANNQAAYDLSIENHSNIKSGSSLVIVSTLDGKITALDKHNGEFLWRFDDAEISPLFSSSLAKIPLKQNGKTVWLIPSLKGRIFKFDGASVESLPITADGLLSSSFKVQDGSILVGDHEVTTFGVDSHDGRLVYFCTSDGCTNLKTPNPDSDIIILKRYQKTVRSVDERNGYVKWNFSVGEFHLDISAGSSNGLLPVKKQSEDCQQTNSERGCHYESLEDEEDFEFSSDFRSYTQDRDDNDTEGKMQVSIPDGLITLMSKKIKWNYKFKSPIANVWQVSGSNYHKLNLFDPSTVPALQQEKHVAKLEPTIYLGIYDKSAYIQISNAIQKFTDSSNRVMNQLAKYSPSVRFTFRPFVASADHLTEATMTDSNEPSTVPSSNTGSCENNWLSFMDTSSKSLQDFGFYLKSTMPYYALPDQSERKGKVTEIMGMTEDDDGASPIYIIYVHSIAWWKQFLVFAIISVMLAFVMHVACQKYGKPQELKAETAVITPEPVPTKESESQNSSLSDPYESRFLHDFEAISCLGKGGFGIVLESRNIVDDCSYAVKRIRLPNKESAREKMLREVRALAKLNHNCIVRYYNAWIEEPPPGWQEDVDETLVSNTNMSSNPFAKSLTSLPLSNTKPKFQASESFSVQRTKDQSPTKRNIFFEPTEPFGFPSIPSGGDFCGFDYSGFSAEKIEESALSDETSNDQSVPFARYTPHNKSLSIVFENSKPGQSTSSRDSAFEEDICPKRHHRIKDHSSAGSSNPLESKKKTEQEAKITDRSTSQLQNVYLYIQMELCLKETLQAWLSVNKKREEDYCLWIMQQVLSAVEYIHESNLIHRDLKPSNVFFSPDGKVKVGDFGLVANIDDFDGDSACDNPSNYSLEESHTERVGTRLYMAPEQMNSRNYSKKVDIYATGIILIELFTPFSTHMERVDVLKKARNGIFDKNFSKSYKKQSKLAKRMLSSEPQHRPTAVEALKDEVFIKS